MSKGYAPKKKNSQQDEVMLQVLWSIPRKNWLQKQINMSKMQGKTSYVNLQWYNQRKETRK